MPIARLVLQTASARPRQVAIRCGERTRTYAQLADDVVGAARAWAQERMLPEAVDGARRVVAIEVDDPLDAVTAVLAVDLLGATPLVCDPAWSAGHRRRALRSVRPAARITTSILRRSVGGMRSGSMGHGVGIAPDDVPATESSWAGFTSGSSGNPRAVVRTATSWTGSYAAVSELTGSTAGDTVLVPGSPASSLFAFAALHTLGVGATLTLLPPGQPGRGRSLTAALAEADVVHVVPHVLAGLVSQHRHGLPARLRTVVVGGAALGPELREAAAEAGVDVVAYYGAAELSFVAVDPDGAGLRPFPQVDIDVRAEPGADAGVVWVRSPWVADGYLAGSGGPLRRDTAGWASVGDLAAPGLPLRLRGRCDGAIVTGGATVVPEDVESVLRGVPGVSDVVVIATAHERLGAIVTAVVEQGDTPVPRAVLEAAARAELTPAQRPRRWFAVRTLPRTSSGKPERAAIGSAIAAGRLPTEPVP